MFSYALKGSARGRYSKGDKDTSLEDTRYLNPERSSFKEILGSHIEYNKVARRSLPQNDMCKCIADEMKMSSRPPSASEISLGAAFWKWYL